MEKALHKQLEIYEICSLDALINNYLVQRKL